jgi:hypothetical protein
MNIISDTYLLSSCEEHSTETYELFSGEVVAKYIKIYIIYYKYYIGYTPSQQLRGAQRGRL